MNVASHRIRRWRLLGAKCRKTTTFDPRSNIPGDGVHYRLVGPFTTLDEATPHVDRTRTVARELDFRADFCSFGVLATEATKPGVLNSKILA